MNKHKRGHRWYDQYPPLAAMLERLKEHSQSDIMRVIRGLRDVIVIESPGLIDRSAMEFPLEMPDKRRWYDFDPLCWLTINSMRYCDDGTLVKCVAYLRECMSGERETSQAALR